MRFWSCALLWLLLLAPEARAAVPFAVNQQGLLVDTAGVPMNGSVDLFFRVWAHPTSNAPADLVYQELHLDRPVVDGVYEAVLGLGSFPAPAFSPALFASPDRWLEIQVESEVLAPRQRILAVPYALQAQLCEFAARAEEADQAQTLNGFTEGDFQSVVTGTCPAGQSIRAIAQNGTVTCELDDLGTGDITGVTAGTGLSGGAASGNATLSIAASGVTSAMLLDGTITNADVAPAAAIAPTKIAGTAATLAFSGLQEFNGGTLVLDTANGGRVGIDTDAPQEKLDIQGNVRAGAFRFVQPKTSFASVAGTDFYPLVSSDGYGTVGGDRYGVSGAAAPFQTGVQLPDGALLTELRCQLIDATPSLAMTVRLWRSVGTSSSVLGAVATSVSGASAFYVEVSAPLSHVVDNQNAYYYLATALGQAGDSTRVSRCTVAYTRSEAD